MNDVHFYYDGISQPARAVWLLLNAAGVKYEPCLVDMLKGIAIAPFSNLQQHESAIFVVNPRPEGYGSRFVVH